MSSTCRSEPRTRRAPFALAAALVGAVSACSLVGDTGGSDVLAEDTVVLVTHDSFAVSRDVLDAFERRSGLTVETRRTGDAGTLANQLVLTKDAPLGDVVYGIDNTFASRTLEAGVLEAYEPPAAADVVPGLTVDDSDRLTPVDYGDVCLNVDERWFADRDQPAPATLADLADPAYAGLTVVSDPATSSPGLAFLLATVDAYGARWPGYWQRLAANDLAVADSWEDAYFVDFTAGGGDGSRPVVLSYASSPPYTVPKGADQPTTRALLETCFRQVEYAGVLEGAQNPDGARQLMDFLLSQRFQRDIPEQMFVYPAVAGSPLPPGWERFAPLADEPYALPAADIDANREEWIRRWTATVVG